MAKLGGGEGILPLDEAQLLGLRVSPAGRIAIKVMLADLRLLREHDLDPVFNCVHGYAREPCVASRTAPEPACG